MCPFGFDREGKSDSFASNWPMEATPLNARSDGCLEPRLPVMNDDMFGGLGDAT
jgi:hypothetical protein